MSTLHVRNVPEGLYESLRERALARGTTISAEAVRLLGRALQSDRPDIARVLEEIEAKRPKRSGKVPSAAELIREDRDRR